MQALIYARLKCLFKFSLADGMELNCYDPMQDDWSSRVSSNCFYISEKMLSIKVKRDSVIRIFNKRTDTIKIEFLCTNTFVQKTFCL